jgi:hypothetical protein
LNLTDSGRLIEANCNGVKKAAEVKLLPRSPRHAIVGSGLQFTKASPPHKGS